MGEVAASDPTPEVNLAGNLLNGVTSHQGGSALVATCKTPRVIVVVSGNDGVGKSTFVSMLAARLSGTAINEPFLENPFGWDYLRAPEVWTYQAEVEFIRRRARAIRSSLNENQQTIVCDRYLWDDVEVFAELWQSLGVLEPREVQSLRDLASDLSSNIPAPSAIVWMRASLPCMARRIEARGYYPQRLSLMEITALREQYYERWLRQRPEVQIVIDTTDRDLKWLSTQADRVAELLSRPSA